MSISNFFTELSWSKTGHGSSFAPADFTGAYVPDDRRLRGYRARGVEALELGPILARQSVSDQFVQYLVNHKLRQAELDDLRKEIEDLKRDNAITQAVDDLKDVEKDINESVMREERAMKAEMSKPLPDPSTPDDDPQPTEVSQDKAAS